MEIENICETVMEELNILIENPSDKKQSERIQLLRSLQTRLSSHSSNIRTSKNRIAAHKDSLVLLKNGVTKTTSRGSVTPLLRNVTPSSYVTSPLENEIITLDDFDFKDDDKINSNEGVFKNLKLLKNHPAHLSIFIQYLISYSSPNPIFYDLICKHILEHNKAELMSSAYALYCNFLANDAPLKINIDISIIRKLNSSIQKSTSSDVCNEVVKLLEVSLNLNEKCLQRLLKEFNEKRAIGLGVFYGENYLHDKLDEKTTQLIIADTLWKNFEKNFVDFSNEISCCTAACLASVLIILNFQPKTNKDYLNICSNFFPAQKSRASNIHKEKFEAPFLSLYGHDCANISYVGPVTCVSCSKPVCSVGNVGYSCKNCRRVFHKICLQLDSTICNKNCNNTTINTINTNNNNYNSSNDTSRRRSIIREDATETTDYNDVTEIPSKSNQSSKIKVFCRASVDPVYGTNKEFCDSDLEYDDSASFYESQSSRRLSTLSTTDKRKQDTINEFRTTERYHVRLLKVMFNVFYVPMCKVCNVQFVQLVFPNLKSLIQLHVNLNADLKAIKGICEDGIIDEFADVLVKHMTGKYGERLEESTALFCQKQSTAILEIDRMQKKDPKFNQILTAASNDKRCRRLNLKDFIPTIIQRFTKYPLLVDNVLKYTQHDSQTYVKLRKVHVNTRKMVESVDAIINEYANMQHMNYLIGRVDKVPPDAAFMHPSVASFTNLKISNHRLLFFGDLRWMIHKNRTIDVQLLLLNNIILILQKVDKRLLLKFESSLNCDKLKSYSNFSPILKLKDVLVKHVPYDGLAFYLICISTKQPQMFHLLCASAEDKNSWFQRIQDAREKHLAGTKKSQDEDVKNGESGVNKVSDVTQDVINVSNETNGVNNVSDVGTAKNDSSNTFDVSADSSPDVLINNDTINQSNEMPADDNRDPANVINNRCTQIKCNASFVQDSRLDFLRDVTQIVKNVKDVMNFEQNGAQELFLHALRNIQNLSDDQVVNISRLLQEQISEILDEIKTDGEKASK